MIVLGIETSCDETAAAVVTHERKILSNVVLSQQKEHLPYGGVVPEIAARSHIDHVDEVVRKAMGQAGLRFDQLDGIAVTGGPGLIGGVIVGVMTAKAIASFHHKPFIAVNHLEGHALTVRLTDGIDFPYLLLLVSGGHCQFLIVEEVGRYTRLGGTLDDALGEAFDKTAKLLGLSYPGGPEIERLARNGDSGRFTLPRPLMDRDDCDFSFSGLKTAVRHLVMELRSAGPLSEQDISDLCASFQACVTEIVCQKSRLALRAFRAVHPDGNMMVLAGGVAANQYIRGALEAVLKNASCHLVAPPISLCTDNAAMIAWAGLERLIRYETSTLDFEPRARWPLDVGGGACK